MEARTGPEDASDHLRPVVTVAVFVVTVAVNSLANIIPIGGHTTAEISDRFAVLVVPAGYVFSIWGLIYVLLGVFTVYQTLPSLRTDPLLRRLGWLPALTGLLNIAWILLWQNEQFAPTLPVMVGLLVTLAIIEIRIRGDRIARTGAERWAVAVPFSVYFGWITVATIANAATVLAWAGFAGGGIDPAAIASAVLLVGLAIAIAMIARFRDPAYGLVIVWAYVGIVVKDSGSSLVQVVAGVAALVVAVVVVVTLVRWRPGASSPAPA